MNTRFDYLYRDASNYKKSNSVVVKGVLKPGDAWKIYESLDPGEDDIKGYFIPRQIGLPEERFEDSPTNDDHCWFEVFEDAFSETDEEPTVDITAEELVEKFVETDGKWDDVTYAVIGGGLEELLKIV